MLREKGALASVVGCRVQKARAPGLVEGAILLFNAFQTDKVN